MSPATETITVTLVHAVGGLMAEIGPMPVIGWPDHVRYHRKYELAADALKARYPELLIRRSCVEDDQVLFWVEHV